MIRKITEFIEKYNMIEEGDLVAAGVSGGADSLCLLFVLLEYRKKVPFDLVVVHVNHGIRQEAVRDADFVKEICEIEQIPFFLREASVKQLADEKKLSEEEAGRMVRYETYYQALMQYGKEEHKGKKIAVAHHQGDSAETLLFHLFRGTGIWGMAGILPVNGDIIRPLLCCDRQEIENYLKEKETDWCIDCTNEEDTYTRNKIRHHILPYAQKEINEKATKHLAQTALQMVELRQYLKGEIERIAQNVRITGEKEETGIDVQKLKTYPEFLQNQFLLWFLEQKVPGRKDISSEHIQAINLLLDKTGTKRLDLPGDMEVVKTYQELWIRKKPKKENVDKQKECIFRKEEILNLQEPVEYILENGDILEISLLNSSDVNGIEEKKYTKYFDYDKINSCLYLRYRQAGDFLVFNDLGQKKLLKEYFIHEKIPAEQRGQIKLVADGSHILWIIGYRISAYYKVTTDTKKIIQMKLRRKNHGRED